MRVFAGPNGSGKSTLKGVLPDALLGVYINPDEIEARAKPAHTLDLSQFGGNVCWPELLEFFDRSVLLARTGWPPERYRRWRLDGQLLQFGDDCIDAYVASVLADFLRRKLLAEGRSFAFETVMSSPDKIDFMREARSAGFRVYLYYIATEDPDINVERVRNRVALGGHPVDEAKIRSRYLRSLDLLFDAVLNSDRAYLFDNSGEEGAQVWVAEVTNGEELELKTALMPHWFKLALWDKFIQDS